MVVIMISINYEIIKQNIKSINKNKILVLKDNAYGFGLSKMLDVALSCDECMFAVKDIKEADVIIKKIPNAMVLILGPILSCDNRYVYTVSNDDDYQFCIKNDLNFHIKLNLGMNRFGFNNLPSYINDNNCLGLYFHCPDKSKKDNIKKLKKFEKITQSIKRQDLIYHVGGSCFIEIEHNFYVRFGISMYRRTRTTCA